MYICICIGVGDLLIDGIDELKSIAEDKSSYLHIPSSLKIIHTLSLY
jgi:hypothetical protein